MKLSPFFLVCVLVGCTTQAQRQYQQMEIGYQSALRSMNDCLLRLLETSAADKLKERFVLEANDARTVEKLATKAHVTADESQAIIDISVLRKPCHKIAIEEFGKVHPAYVASLARLFAEADADLAKAINRELTIGELNQRTIERANRWQAEFTQIGQQIVSQLNQAHQYEMTQRQIAAQALQTWAYQQQVLYNQQQIINAVNASRVTAMPTAMTCRFIGNMIHCF